MRALAGALVLLVTPTAAQADQCQERCGARFSSCATTCDADPKCSRRCDANLQTCTGGCPIKTPSPKDNRCFDRKGRLEPCDDIIPKPKKASK